MSGGSRRAELDLLLAERVLILDGAMGTMLAAAGLQPTDFGGEAYEGCNEQLVRTCPELVAGVHRAYLEAGADIVSTDTFGASPVVLTEYGLDAEAEALNLAAARLARSVADELATTTRPRFVAGSIGPTTKALSITGGIAFAELAAGYEVQARGLLAGGVDLFLVETCPDTLNAKAALLAIARACAEARDERPVVVSATFERGGATLAGQRAEAFAASLGHADLLAVGLNCGTGPGPMADSLRALDEWSEAAVVCYPNAGMPDADGRYPMSPGELAAALERYLDRGWVNVVGGCCGTTAEHVAAIAEVAEGKRPRPLRTRPRRVVFSGVDLVEATPETRPLLVGERTNVVGSRGFARMVAEERWDDAVEVAREQVRAGAQLVDVCLASPDRAEVADVEAFYPRLARAVRVPLVIDSTDPEAIEAALRHCQGRSLVNSVNLEEGGRRIERVAPLLRAYGAAVVVGAIDDDPDQAQAFTRERKLAVLTRAHRLLTGRHRLRDQDLVFDPLVFPAASGDAAYVGAAVETIEGLRLVKQAFPDCRTILGISNVSFGLPPGARALVNAVFLHHCTLAGLDLAIVNARAVERYASLPEADRELAEDLLFNRPPRDAGGLPPEASALVDASADWREQGPEERLAINRLHVARLAGRPARARVEADDDADLPLDRRLARRIVEGSRRGLEALLERRLAEGADPLEIVNGPLMEGMAEVGRLFDANELIVAEVLESAEVMKAAVSFLEARIEGAVQAARGRVVLATVKGDVHDIGKNLVEIILSNNGYEVVDLGIKVPPASLVAACREHRPDAIGLSGLLVRSAWQMATTTEELAAAGIDLPLLVGGAALTRRFTTEKIDPLHRGPVVYCRDAMAGLEALERLRRGATPDARPRTKVVSAPKHEAPASAPPTPSPKVDHRLEPLPPPSAERHLLERAPDLDPIWELVNLDTLFVQHLGLRGPRERLLAAGDEKALRLGRLIDEVMRDARPWMRVGAVWRFFEATAGGDEIVLYEAGAERELARLAFPRQSHRPGLCLADYVLPPAGGARDSVALFVVTAGEGVREHAAALKAAGEYLRSHALQALALETAEAAAEWLHARLRSDWGFPDPEGTPARDLLRGRYRGRRYSPGYPACPGLDAQEVFWRLLEPEAIGARLTEEMMIDPEASVSALVVHHPEARYFTVRERGPDERPRGER